MALSAPEFITAAHEVAQFTCGKPALDHWLQRRALSSKGFTAVTVVHEAQRVVGFYGLAPTAVVADVLPRPVRGGQPPDPVPCLLLGQLATDVEWAGQGIGAGLLKHALRRCVDASRQIGEYVVVHAVDTEASEFWQRCGFIPSRDDPLVLFQAIARISASLAISTP